MATFSSKLRGIKLKKFEEFDIEKIFYWFSELSDTNVDLDPTKDKYFIRSLARIFKNLFLDNKYELIEDSKSEILFSIPHTLRQAIVNMIHNVAQTTEHHDLFRYTKRTLTINLNNIKICILCFHWYKNLSKISINVGLKLFIISKLVDLYKYSEKTKVLDINKYKLLVVFYDATYFENFLVQKFKHQGIKTATLQHGTIIAPRPTIKDNIEFRAVEFQGSISDYFLVWNQFTKDEAIKTGLSEHRVIPLGIPYYIGVDACSEKISNNVFGVVLSTKFMEHQNRQIIEFANQMAKSIGYKYILRYHPNFRGDEYKSIVDNDFYIGISDKHTSVKEYTSLVEFSIISSSSVFLEFVYLKHKTFRFSPKTEDDKFIDIKDMAFSSIEELIELFQNSKEQNDSLFDYLCKTRDVKNSYATFFEKFRLENEDN